MSAEIVPSGTAELAQLAEEVRWHERHATEHLVGALVHYAEAGARLNQAKADPALKHGHWLAWLEREFVRDDGRPWSERYVRYLMEWAKLVAASSPQNRTEFKNR